MRTEKIAIELANIARKDFNAGVKLYAAINQGPVLHKRLNKITPLPGPAYKGDYQYLRMMYTSFRWWIEAHKDN